MSSLEEVAILKKECVTFGGKLKSIFICVHKKHPLKTPHQQKRIFNVDKIELKDMSKVCLQKEL